MPAMDDEKPSAVFRSLMNGKPRGTQAALARELRVRPQTVTKWLKGDVQLPIERWLRIERFLEIEPLTIARRTGLINAVPELAQIPIERLDATWRASFSWGRERREAIEEGAIQVALSVDETAALINDQLRKDPDAAVRLIASLSADLARSNQKIDELEAAVEALAQGQVPLLVEAVKDAGSKRRPTGRSKRAAPSGA